MIDVLAMRNAPTRSEAGKRRVLNTGSGPAAPHRLHPVFAPNEWQEVRLDINPAVQPDLVGTIGDMRRIIEDANFDAIWSSHNIEHLPAFEVVPALQEFRRILKPDGFAFITCPDLEAICRLILERGVDVPVYTSAAGPITPLDMLYGHGRSIKDGNPFMSHRSAFTEETLGKVAIRAGFDEARVFAATTYDLWAILMMPRTDRSALNRMLVGTEQAYLVE